jgi:hypothetical protein
MLLTLSAAAGAALPEVATALITALGTLLGIAL